VNDSSAPVPTIVASPDNKKNGQFGYAGDRMDSTRRRT
jgi:hypothetical protein